ncbi:MAG TPA: ubiquinol-cytochrome C chaperone family protein, partial [Caulobacteraceae bacterium]|nr:ubiquinol-cytochrome C chaperone family protein [Caulobacteraceae bacterium]
MLLQRLFRAPPAQDAGRGLYAAAALQARRPVFYRALGVADTVEGRFELYSLHVALVLIRL